MRLLLERDRRAPLVTPLDHKDLAAQYLMENLLKRPHMAERSKGARFQQEGSFVLARDRCRVKRADVPGQLARGWNEDLPRHLALPSTRSRADPAGART